MKKFSKMLALGLAAAMVFGMTVSAADSPVTDEAKDMAANVTVEGAVMGHFETEEAFKEAKSTAQNVEPADVSKGLVLGSNESITDVKAVKAFEVYAPAGWKKGDAAVEVTFRFESTLFSRWKKYVLIHIPEEGDVEVFPVNTTAEGGVVTVKASFNSFSPVVLAEVTVETKPQDGKPGDDGKPGPTGPQGSQGPKGDTGATGAAGTSAAGSATAPKTGEAAPVAGIMALILMAGAVICAGKVRYNR